MRNLKFFKNNSQGFTLIELLVVIAIIGILATMSVIALGGARKKARDAKRISAVKSVQTALEMYYTDNRQYPTTTGAFSESKVLSGLNSIKKIPTNPSPENEEISDTGNVCPKKDYQYFAPTDGTTYTIGYCIGSSSNLDSAGIHCATPVSINDGKTCESSNDYKLSIY